VTDETKTTKQKQRNKNNETKTKAPTTSEHVYEVRPRKDHRGVHLISDTLPFGRSPAHENTGAATTKHY